LSHLICADVDDLIFGRKQTLQTVIMASSEDTIDLPEIADEAEEIPAELLEELDRELARNAEANRMAKEREIEAKAARDRYKSDISMVDTYMFLNRHSFLPKIWAKNMNGLTVLEFGFSQNAIDPKLFFSGPSVPSSRWRL
jgi:hypothetical protein